MLFCGALGLLRTVDGVTALPAMRRDMVRGLLERSVELALQQRGRQVLGTDLVA